MKRTVFAAFLVIATATVSPLHGIDYPTQPITLVCPWDAGGSSDLSCRVIGSLGRKYMGTTINVVNRPGGNGAVAYGEMASRTKADGYTMSLCASGGFNSMPFVQDTGYTIDDFEFIAGTTTEPLAVIVHSDSDLHNLQDIVDRFKKTGEPVAYGMSGSNSPNHLYTIKMFRNMGVKEQIVPYSGAAGALTALLGNEVEMIIIHPGMVLGSIENGDARVIAMMFKDRVPTFPDVPTVEEQGFGLIHVETYKAIIVPRDTNPEIVKWLNEKLNLIMQDQEWIDFLKNNGIEKTRYKQLGEYRNALEKDIQLLWPLMEELKLLKPGAVKPSAPGK
ncbi:MAG: tripartite tricarboxylate transporter substrate binding protein [Planctomycetota bacterium]|jgi:tripartite-type tricarboxylate transporter receptor subunit TctC|nr:tripartite tricarboxylate transporter substrate binding protein [Planctomycetota bacterium]